MGNHIAHTDKDICDALRAHRGLISVTARALGIDRKTIYNRLDTSPEVREALEEAREVMGDVAEDKLFDAIEDKQPWAISMYLSTVHRGRGYGDHVSRRQFVRVMTEIARIVERHVVDDDVLQAIKAEWMALKLT